MSQIWIGTSGWHYKHWVGRFYPSPFPSSRMLAYYCTVFKTVELNTTFYHLPSSKSLDLWRGSTPENFLFSAKGSRFLTHMKKLKDAESGLKRFLESVEILGEKLGPIIFQLPPTWEVNVERLAEFLALLPAYHRFAFEFRNPTWNTEAVDDLLKRHNAAYCIFDLAGFQTEPKITADFAYVRLHGPGGKYQGSYSDEALRAWAEQIKNWQERLHSVYLYFDNDDSGYAAHNALRLQQLVSGQA